MREFFMQDAKRLPKFSAGAIMIAQNGRPHLFLPAILLAFTGAGTIDGGSLFWGIVIGIIAVSVAAYSLPQRLLGGGR